MFRFINPHRQTKGIPRRDFLRVGGYGLGSMALGNLLAQSVSGTPMPEENEETWQAEETLQVCSTLPRMDKSGAISR